MPEDGELPVSMPPACRSCSGRISFEASLPPETAGDCILSQGSACRGSDDQAGGEATAA